VSTDYEQKTRGLSITTPLGKDVLLLTSMSGEEQISRLFSYELRMLSTKDSIKAQDIVGKNVTFQVDYADGSPRNFNGFVSRFAYLGTGDRLSEYRMQVVPWLWFLTLTAKSRIYQEKSVVDIIKDVFSKLGFSSMLDDQTKGSHPKWEYCVQYRETDFNFVSRLMEQEGIFYFFKHDQGKHTLVMADQKSSYQDVKDNNVKFEFNLSGPNPWDQILSWEHQYEFRSGKWAQTDYNFETPSTSLLTNTKTTVDLPGVDKYEVYDYPGEYEKKPDGDADTKLRMEAEEVGYNMVHGTSYCRSFTPGGKFKLTKHHSSAEAGKGYVIVGTRHWAGVGGTYLTGSAGGESGYGNAFTCIPDSVTFRPARVTPKPHIHGTQTALVVGPGGEEIWPDKYGRVKVQFYWDREGKKDDKSSCWIRVAHPWAGKQWGAVSIPRIGQEVVVSYLEGDPDRPLITGMVYNAESMPPYTLPDNKTQTGLKTRSSKNGTSENFNELRFEDKKDSEQIYFHAQKNFDRVVENNDTLKVGTSDSQYTPDGSRTVEIWNNHSLKVGAGAGSANDGSQTIDVYHNRTETVQTGNELVTIQQGNRTVNVNQGDDTHNIQQGNRAVVISMGNDSLAIKMGNQTTKLDLGASSTEAMQSITLKVGQSSITLDQTGVTIQGMMISINGQVQTQVQGVMTQIQGSAMTQISGGITMIG
jgi:type VI secretion system secreted protein VgrG